MKTVQIKLDDGLVKEMDRVSKRLHISRSAFACKALREALARYDVTELESKHRQGYERHPVAAGEFSVWEDDQARGDK